jgi:hypothetical protein
MTGTRNSNKQAAAALTVLVCGGAWCLPLAADDLMLNGAERVSGTVRTISEDGAVLLETPLAPDPVTFNGDSVRKVVFSEQPDKPDAATGAITLVNGDVIPGDVEAIDSNNLTLLSSVTGRVVIPRALLYSMQLGAHQPSVIYAGPEGLNGWSREPSTAGHWSFTNGVFHVRGGGKINRNFELPPRFIVRFNLSWDADPNIKFYFACAPGFEEREQDRYYLSFNAAGMEIKRESSSGRRYTTITTLNRLPQQYPGKQLKIEIRVDRTDRTLQLYLNDEPEGPFRDISAKAPAANGIGFENMTEEEGTRVRIHNIEVLNWNLKGERRRTEERGDTTQDVLIGTKAERFSGQILEAKKGADGMLYVFKTAFQDAPLEVPESEVATLFFVANKQANANAAAPPYILQLRASGSLHVSSCAFSATQVEATHPLLGRLTLQREGVTALERVTPKPDAAKEP